MGIDANPIVDSFGCCARAASGHAAAVPPKRDEVAPLHVRHGGLPPLCAISAADWPVRSVFRTSSLPQGGLHVLGADLNRSESRGSTRPTSPYDYPSPLRPEVRSSLFWVPNRLYQPSVLYHWLSGYPL